MTTLHPHFITAEPKGALAQARLRGGKLPELLRLLLAAPHAEAADCLRSRARRIAARGEAELAILPIEQLVALIDEEGPDTREASDLRATLLALLTALHIEAGQADEALGTGAQALTQLAQEPRRKDEPFLSVLAALLFDLAHLHADRNELRQAEREIEKSARMLERLARIDPERYGAAHLLAIDAASSIYRSRVKQAEMLAHYQVASATYMQILSDPSADDSAVREATLQLVQSLATQGRTLMQMGKDRQAVAPLSRALKIHTQLQPEPDLEQLTLSVDLGEALLAIPASREKGVHLLNTLLHKATRLGATGLHERITELLDQAKTSRLDILSFWHKLFPR